MACEFVAGRAELAPQTVQAVTDEIDNDDGDVVGFVEDEVEESPSGLMTTSESEQSATH